MKNKFCISIFMFALFLALPPCNAFSYSVNDFSAIDRQIEENVKSCHIPGMAVIVVDENNVLFSKTYGNCKSMDAPFLIGSLSKSFTALSVMQLVEQGKIDLNAPISKYLDCSLYLKKPSDGDKITVKQLLNQTSGFGTYHKFGTAQITKTYGKFVYSNVNYSLLGKIIQAVSGESYSDYVERHIFAPLKMEKTSATLNDSKADGLIKGYRNYFGFPVAGAPDYPTDRSWSGVSAGYISSSAADMGKYLQMYLNGGGGVISKESINTMFYDNVPQTEDKTDFYGMGWVWCNDYFGLGEQGVNHSGLVENFATNMVILPESKIGVAVLVNMNDYFVANSFLLDCLLPLLGIDLPPLVSHAYMKAHLFLDLIYLVILIIAVLPLVFIKRWKQKAPTKPRLVFDILLHAVLPILLLCVSSLLGIPLWVVWYFLKDLFLVLVVSAVLLFATGVYKIVYRQKMRAQK